TTRSTSQVSMARSWCCARQASGRFWRLTSSTRTSTQLRQSAKAECTFGPKMLSMPLVRRTRTGRRLRSEALGRCCKAHALSSERRLHRGQAEGTAEMRAMNEENEWGLRTDRRLAFYFDVRIHATMASRSVLDTSECGGMGIFPQTPTLPFVTCL